MGIVKNRQGARVVQETWIPGKLAVDLRDEKSIRYSDKDSVKRCRSAS